MCSRSWRQRAIDVWPSVHKCGLYYKVCLSIEYPVRSGIIVQILHIDAIALKSRSHHTVARRACDRLKTGSRHGSRHAGVCGFTNGDHKKKMNSFSNGLNLEFSGSVPNGEKIQFTRRAFRFSTPSQLDFLIVTTSNFAIDVVGRADTR